MFKDCISLFLIAINFFRVYIYASDKLTFVVYIHPLPGQPQLIGLAKYDKRELLGTGGYGSVYLYDVCIQGPAALGGYMS